MAREFYLVLYTSTLELLSNGLAQRHYHQGCCVYSNQIYCIRLRTCMTRLATSPAPAGRTKRPTLPTTRASMHKGGQAGDEEEALLLELSLGS
jgi:hypothetical protein